MKYLDRIVRGIIKSEVIEELKSEIIAELKAEEGFKETLSMYKVKVSDKGKLTIYTAMELYEVEEISVKMTFLYDVGATKDINQKYTSISEMVADFKTIVLDKRKLEDAGIVGLKDFNIYVWYTFKGDRTLVSEHFLRSYDAPYDLKAGTSVMLQMIKWSKNHPELLV